MLAGKYLCKWWQMRNNKLQLWIRKTIFKSCSYYWYDPYGIKLITKMSTISSHQRCSIKKNVLKNFAIFKKRLQQRYFPVNIAKCRRTPILKNICERLFLDHEIFLRLTLPHSAITLSPLTFLPLPNII